MNCKIKKLSDVAQLLNGYAFKSKNYVKNGIRIIRITNVQNGYICDEKSCFYPENAHKKIEAYLLRKGDLLVSLTGNIGRVGILPSSMLPAALNQRVCCIRIKDNSVLNKYLYYYFLRNQFVRDCTKASKGVAQLNLSTQWFKNYTVPIPSLEEQHRIVSRIEEFFSGLDKAVETLKTIKRQLEVYRQAVLKEMFDIINNYKSLEFISEKIFDGPFGSNLKTSDYTNDGIRVIRLENLKNLTFDDSKKSFITKEKYNIIKKHTVYPSDILMATFLSKEIKVCQISKNIPFAVNKADCLAIRIKPEYITKYVLYYLSSKKVYNELSLLIHGATRPRVNTEQVKSIRIPVCSKEKQHKIVNVIESRFSVCDNIEKTVNTALLQAEALRQSILKQAFEGELIK